MSKTVQLSFAAIVAIILFFMLPPYNDWYNTVVLDDLALVPAQLDHLDIEYRTQARYKENYAMDMAIIQFFQEDSLAKSQTRPLLLLPPTAYLHAKGAIMQMPQPPIFYYFTGIRSVWSNSSNVDSANWVILPTDNQMYIFPIENRHQLDSLLVVFKPYPPTSL